MAARRRSLGDLWYERHLPQENVIATIDHEGRMAWGDDLSAVPTRAERTAFAFEATVPAHHTAHVHRSVDSLFKGKLITVSPSTARHFLLRDIRIGRYSVFLPGGINPSSPAEFCFRHDECILYDEMGRQCASSTPPGSWGIRCDLLPPIPETEQAKKVSLQLSNFDFPVAQIGDILTFILHNASDLELNVSLMLYGLRVV